MVGLPGHGYVYLIYGMHPCFNVVTEPEGCPAAVLVRALEPLEGVEVMRAHRKGRRDLELTNGPAKLCYALSIDRGLNGADLVGGDDLWIEEDVQVDAAQTATVPKADRSGIAAGPRVGVRGDELALSVEWRFWVEGNRYVSRG